jgi:NAD(P)H dehydrogenase (quinone)
MNVLIIYAHPSSKSFTHEIFEALVNGLSLSNHQVEISDLYKMNFQSDMTEIEYEREGLANTKLPIPDDIILEHQKIEKADCIIFLYPVWWSDCPAKLKGWFDRVYSVGYAYGYDENGHKVQQMKRIKLGLVVCTAGHSNDFLENVGISESMKKNTKNHTIMLVQQFGEIIKARRKELKITQPHLAELANINTNTLYKLERGQSNPSLEFTDDYKSEAYKKRGHAGKTDFLELAKRIGVSENRADKLLSVSLEKQLLVKTLVKHSFLSEANKRKYYLMYQTRLNALLEK